MTSSVDSRRRRTLPEIAAGGFSRYDGSVEFYLRVGALVNPDSVVLDFGAGRGHFLEDEVPFRRGLHTGLQERAGRFIGVDVDPVVKENPTLDEAHVIEPGARLPLADASVDVVISDFTFEHVATPGQAAAELERVLRPGGWICARTPNRWGLIAVPARLVPNRMHSAVLRRLQPGRQVRDTFPTCYLMNDTAALRRLFPESRFRHCSYTHESEPAYAGGSAAAWTLFHAIAAVTPAPLRSMLFVFLQKR